MVFVQKQNLSAQNWRVEIVRMSSGDHHYIRQVLGKIDYPASPQLVDDQIRKFCRNYGLEKPDGIVGWVGTCLRSNPEIDLHPPMKSLGKAGGINYELNFKFETYKRTK